MCYTLSRIDFFNLETRTSPRKRIPNKSARYVGSTPTTPDNRAPCSFSSTSPMTPNPRDEWQQPTIGWCYDEKTLERRTKVRFCLQLLKICNRLSLTLFTFKEVDKAKAKPVYQRYIKEVQKFARQKGLHPRTPNKYLNYSRRSWDSQVGQKKKSFGVIFS